MHNANCRLLVSFVRPSASIRSCTFDTCHCDERTMDSNEHLRGRLQLNLWHFVEALQQLLIFDAYSLLIDRYIVMMNESLSTVEFVDYAIMIEHIGWHAVTIIDNIIRILLPAEHALLTRYSLHRSGVWNNKSGLDDDENASE
jgi:hypothetical protein